MPSSEYEHAPSSQEQTESPFPFVGEVLALDLVNTEILLRGKRHEFLTTPEAAARWWQEATRHYPTRDYVQGEDTTTRWNADLLEGLKRLRAALRQLFLSLIEQQPIRAQDLEELNRILALGHQTLAQGADNDLEPIYQTSQPETGAIFLPIVLSALRLILEGERDRLRKCRNERCIGLFYDTTRSATRHWCSPPCLRRAKSMQHYRRTKGGTDAHTTSPVHT